MATAREISSRDLASALATRSIKVILDGDSRTAFGYSTSGVKTVAKKLQSYWYYVEALTGGRVYCPTGNNVAVAGQRTDEVLARSVATMALDGDVIILWMGVNNQNQPRSLADTISDFQAYIEKARIAGKRLIILNELPNNASPSAATITFIGGVREFLRSLPKTTHLAVVDPLPLVVSDALATTPTLRADCFADYLHPTAFGDSRIATPIANLLNQWFPPLNLLPYSNGFSFAQVGKGGNHVVNSMMGGTAGSKGSLVTGSVADNWSVSRLGAGSADSNWTVVGSKVAASDGLGAWQQIDIAGTNPSTQLLVQVLQNMTLADFSAGDRLEMVGEMSIDTATISARDVQMGILLTDSEATNASAITGGSNSGQQLPVTNLPLLRSPEILVASGLSKAVAYFQATVDVGSAPALSFRFRNLAVRKV